MRLSAKSKYGARAMMELARNYGKGEKVLSVHSIAEKQNISERYLQNILLMLVDAGLLKSVRGKKGGFILARNPLCINVAEMLHVLEEGRYLIDCVENEQSCYKCSTCIVKGIFKKASATLYNFLSKISLSELAKMSSEGEPREKKLDFNI